ncbi:outer membrane lipoprotein carrier protein LolA [Shewanella sp. JNE10-2]|uniref:outer membrane lipoprotein carrier protein LolA n=1 Tax=unclassified Shewanella TaxID=196818 RepID=UPI00200537B0|nr:MULTISPECIES: outer membrane lipoprotein carrier protein LolA [unclassified Shewanella]MCK7631912.1 outer membrane lipoprotein carrier protein LolA [Shewanella sp. JNE9-1]MCK7636105.1 outer membrane lipoprotein carrier protein LolA [Shewanella sp. JNE17]MCK7647082.1 outer membrane lipoprotein carrier protein LolA [Shewanella sp. JNE3-1]MCK7651280.1 outer membrane lipoprotein carrier protein LolA [Shewanella sp. JNE8]MCK7655219.1 outer membrane lipoprotein carrier protein LolA [Shewanella sp
MNATLTHIKLMLILCFCSVLISAQCKADTSTTAVSANNYQQLFTQTADKAQLVALSQKLNLGETVRGQFVQSRQLKVLKKPLISQGQFIFDKEQGLIWQQIKPFESLLILKDKQLIQRDSQGRVQVSKADASASAAAMGDLLPSLVRAMLGGDISSLSENFELHFLIADRLSPDGQWQLGLTPKDPLMKKAIANMVLEGSDVLQSLVLLSAAPNVSPQDMTRIDFSALSQGKLSETELAQYAVAIEAKKP